MFKKIDNALAYRVYTGGPIINVFSISKDGVFDGMTAAWNCPFDTDELIVVIDKGHTTTQNILDTGKLVLAIPCENNLRDLLKLGSSHGRDNKNKISEVVTEKTANFEYPILKGSLAYFECVLNDKALFADKGICLAKVEHVYVEKSLWDDMEDAFVPGCFETLSHVKGATFSKGGKIIE